MGSVKVAERILGEVLCISIPTFDDARGSFAVSYEEPAARAIGIPYGFVQDNHSVSCLTGTVRGLHLQLPPFEQGKLVRVLRGRMIDVFVDLRAGSPTRGSHGIVELSGDDDRVLWVPRGFAHGFCTVEPETEVFYKVDGPYHPEAERTLAWDDPVVGIDWPVAAEDVMLSEKDAVGLSLAETLDLVDRASSLGQVTGSEER